MEDSLNNKAYVPSWPKLYAEDPDLERCLAKANMAGVTTREIAEKSNVSRPTLWRWKQGISKPTLSFSARKKFIDTVNALRDAAIAAYVKSNDSE